jgi:hypothetical protein
MQNIIYTIQHSKRFLGKCIICLVLFVTPISKCFSQESLNQSGAWYMYFYSLDLDKSEWGVQGDLQYRNWNALGDLEQLLVRSGVTFKPKETTLKFTLGLANITSGAPGASNKTTAENRVYQEALLPQKIGKRLYLTHRFRYEQRFVQNQDFRTRYRYNLFLNIPLNKSVLEKDALYLALYNEIFINGQSEIGNARTVSLFDRNRTYLGAGWFLNSKTRIQLGWMNQKTPASGKAQWQVSVHSDF